MNRGRLSSVALFLAAGLLGRLEPGGAQEPSASGRHVDARRLQGTLEKLSEFGRNPEGGVTRIGFSETDLAAREYVISLMKEARLEVRVDPAGNIFGRRAGSLKLPVLLFGSHIDSVRQGGNFDGDVGSLGALEVIRALNDGGVKTRHPLEVVDLDQRRGQPLRPGYAGLGSRRGAAGPRDSRAQGRAGADPRGLAAPLRSGSVASDRRTTSPRVPWPPFWSCTSSRARTSTKSQIPIGVVQGIVGLKRWRCVVTGFANHAGTTPMNRRKDALAAASRDVLAVRDVVRAEAGRQVGTVGLHEGGAGSGQRGAGPGRVPGRAARPRRRDHRPLVGSGSWQRFERDRRRGSVSRRGAPCSTTWIPLARIPPCRGAIREAARSLGLATADLPSGAVQDAQQIAAIAPIGMIFVPSREGISHSPEGIHLLAGHRQRGRGSLSLPPAAGREAGSEGAVESRPRHPRDQTGAHPCPT